MANHQAKPAFEVRLGTIRATVWANRNRKGDVWFNVTLSRFYLDGTSWKETHSYRRDDLPVAAKALEMAYDYIWRHQTSVATKVSE